MADERLPDYPNSDPRSFGYGVARAAIDAATSFVPGASFAVGAIVEHVVAAPLQKRRDEWFEQVGKGIQELQDRLEDFDSRTLAENDDFVSAVYEATQAAMKTTNEAKIEALRNGILNIAAGMTVEEVLRGTFFSLIDRLSPAHLRVLSLLADPSSSPEMLQAAKNVSMGAQYNIIREAIPETLISESVLARILSDLGRDGLAQTDGMKATGTAAVLLAKRTTEAGDAFLRFVSSPQSAD